MTVSLAASAATAATPAAQPAQASQNLFEHMAESARSAPNQGASPQQIGDSLMERLNGFMDRQRHFSQQADALVRTSAPASPANANQPPPTLASAEGQAGKGVGDGQIDQIVHSLGRMFDYSIETQMVVRGATQISGSANTLIKGQ